MVTLRYLLRMSRKQRRNWFHRGKVASRKYAKQLFRSYQRTTGKSDLLQLIPHGFYCTSCPFWSSRQATPNELETLGGGDQTSYGACSLLKVTDNDTASSGLLWDQAKICCLNEESR